ncbi:MAG: DUF2284 domain-containing protein [Oscillospiraceae bacterium]
MTWEEMTSIAAEEGFAAAVVTDTKDIPFDPSFRPLCAENLCGKYGANYSCPPDCGTPDEMRARIQAHRHALVLQTIWEIADYSDSKAIKAAKKEHNAATLRLLGRLRRADVPGFPVGASGCALCETCAITEKKPCRYPDLYYSCMSAYCIFVRRLAEQCGMEYDCGPGLLAFFGMYVFD